MNNKIVISAAGSRKTTYIVEDALEKRESKTLILTYTIDNMEQIKSYIIDRNGVIPPNIRVQTWFTFLLQHCVRPYQNFVYSDRRIENIFFVQGISAQFIKKENVAKYYFAGGDKIYTDKISEFCCQCNEKSGGLVIKRLEAICDHIYIDEIQDLAGYDFEFLELLLTSNINVTLVGDNRQATYVTNYSPKNKKFKGKNIINLFREWEAQTMCTIEERNECYRCNQEICDFGDALYPLMTKTISRQILVTDHHGLFIIKKKDVEHYLKKYNPRILRYMIGKETAHLNAINFGQSKGMTFDRVLIFPTQPIRDYLKTGDLNKVGDQSKLYVAVTRARHSVAFIYEGNCHFPGIKLYSP